MLDFILKSALKDKDVVKLIVERITKELMSMKVEDYAKLYNVVVKICNDNKLVCMKIYELANVVTEACISVLKQNQKPK